MTTAKEEFLNNFESGGFTREVDYLGDMGVMGSYNVAIPGKIYSVEIEENFVPAMAVINAHALDSILEIKKPDLLKWLQDHNIVRKDPETGEWSFLSRKTKCRAARNPSSGLPMRSEHWGQRTVNVYAFQIMIEEALSEMYIKFGTESTVEQALEYAIKNGWSFWDFITKAMQKYEYTQLEGEDRIQRKEKPMPRENGDLLVDL